MLFCVKIQKMFLKSLILRGFKTFADKVEFDFLGKGGITAIVGPNGCGKSNVVDAFRFALGEANFRELRVNSLPEVIFAGTARRKPLSLAEVTLIFDNSSGFLPIDYTEVSAKRKTFKDGTSEFLINQQACRLKDIRSLFLDTGISCESLSIIGQGRVDAILASRPEERRAFFEEVAGIHKYKTRKLEVERKLILCEQNLLRISDLKIEIGEQAIMLEAQARKAREYNEIRLRVHDLEMGMFKKQVLDLLLKIEGIEERIAGLKQQANEVSGKTRKISEEKIQLKEKIKRLEDEIESIYLKIEEAKEKIKSEQSSILIERERAIFAEKNKIRDIVEEERFIKYEISKLENTIPELLLKKDKIKSRIAEWSQSEVPEIEGLKSLIGLGLKIIERINFLAVALNGKEGIALRSQSEDKIVEMFRSELKKFEEEETLLNDNLKSKKKEAEKLKRSAAELKNKLDMLEASECRTDSDELKMLGELLEMLEKLKSEKNNCRQILDGLEAQPAGQISGAEDLMKEEVSLAKLQGELLQVEERIKSEYGLEREKLLAQPLKAENMARSRKEAEELKVRQRELEPVNLLAIEEYEKIKERHTFIENQYADLVSARENLNNLIAELDAKADEDFKKTMEVVARNFSEIFASLFEGGEALIEVVQNEGIEISVCPSGRKWLNLSLLSGGERSLTAIALLLAFLKTQPSPLCILDEVDAALDEANVSRFARFISEFSNKTQILIITHNKRTIEAADVIYGITMEEPGVSKVVSMRLEKV